MTEDEADLEVARRNTTESVTQTAWYEGDRYYVAVERSPGDWDVQLHEGKPPAKIWQWIGHLFS